jgi:hypothetical protein
MKPSEILVLSFSRNAVRTLMTRLASAGGDDPVLMEDLRHLTVRTFDSWAFRILRQCDESPADLLRRGHDENIDDLTRRLQTGKGEQRKDVMRLLRPLRHIIVDEFQDLSGVRGALVLQLLLAVAPPTNRRVGFTILGDPAQAIYAFTLRENITHRLVLSSGELIGSLTSHYGRSLRRKTLDRNFRSDGDLAPLIRRLRSVLLGDGHSAREKLEEAQALLQRVAVTTTGLEPSNLRPEGMRTGAVLTSTNAEAMRVAQKLWKAPYDPVMPVFLHSPSQPRGIPAWIGATLGQINALQLSRSHFSRLYAWRYPPQTAPADVPADYAVPAEDAAWALLTRICGTGPESRSVSMADIRQRLGWADTLPDATAPPAQGIHVMTIHQSKGMEFDAVAVLAGDGSRPAPSTEEEEQEAANVLFVGMSRASRCLGRVDSNETYGPMFRRPVNGRERLYSWRNGWVNLEIGLPGDVNPQSFVDMRVFSDVRPEDPEAAVAENQEFLAANAARLGGMKVCLKMWPIPGLEPTRIVYRIHLDEDGAPGRPLGVTAEPVTQALLDLLWPKYRRFPATMYNLRIMEVTTINAAGEAGATLPAVYRQGGLWLGVNIQGTGDFRTYSR